MQTTCLGCGLDGLDLLIDFGPQPPSNRFHGRNEADDVRHRLTVAQCQNCGLVQLVNPMPPPVVQHPSSPTVPGFSTGWGI